jgi:hypothetical protein
MAANKTALAHRNRRLRGEVELAAKYSFTDEGWKIFLDKEVGDDEPYSPDLVEDLVELLPGYFMVAERAGSRPPSRRVRTGSPNEAREAYEGALSWFASRHVSTGVEFFRKALLEDQLLPGRKARTWLNRLLREEGEERDLRREYRELMSLPVDTLLPVFGISVIELRDPVQGRDYWAPVEPGNSNVDWLRRISESLAEDLGWARGEATLWVLSGAPPSTEMVRTVFHPSPRTSAFGERIQMTIDPATTPREVMNVYHEARSRVVGKRVRSQGPKHLTLATFEDRRPDDETWEQAMRRWNDAHASWRYSRVSNFARDARSAKQRFLHQRPFAGSEE